MHQNHKCLYGEVLCEEINKKFSHLSFPISVESESQESSEKAELTELKTSPNAILVITFCSTGSGLVPINYLIGRECNDED